MTRYLTLREVLTLHERIAATSGGGLGVRDLGLLESAIAQPKQSFGDSELYPSIQEKAGALGFFIVSDGSGTPYRVRVRPPCWFNLQGVRSMVMGGMLADIIPTFGSINMIGGECDR